MRQVRNRIWPLAAIAAASLAFWMALAGRGGATHVDGAQHVFVNNPAKAPANVFQVNEPVRQPWHKSMYFLIPDGRRFGSREFSVPAGKRLVIEVVNVEAEQARAVSELKVVCSVRTGVYVNDREEQAFYNFPASFGGDFGNFGFSKHLCDESLRLYADEKTDVLIQVGRNDPRGPMYVHPVISGYLEDV